MNAGVRKSRNPLFNPGHIFGKFLDTNSIDSPKTKMQLSEHVHPLVRSSRLRGSLVGVSLAKKLLNELAQYSVSTTQCGVQLK